MLNIYSAQTFLSTLSLRRATLQMLDAIVIDPISIHALLAESDLAAPCFHVLNQNFYPRSPCGERPQEIFPMRLPRLFLSTLSLRRATLFSSVYLGYMKNFYPRSPCGERLLNCLFGRYGAFISIHALLAESDRPPALINLIIRISIHALLAESDYAVQIIVVIMYALFLSTLSLRRATHYDNYNLHCTEISIHALLAESDVLMR